MKILFVENRYCTFIWHEVGRRLARHGHDVRYLVQNPVFTPMKSHCFVMPFPSRYKFNSNDMDISDIPEKILSDRAARYWGGGISHYPHYMRIISDVLDEFQPDVIFGEPTQFHEIITIELARRKGVPYLFPSSTRYPSGRLVFFKSDTMEPLFGEGREMQLEHAVALRRQIANRESVPSYMVYAQRSAFSRFTVGLQDKFRITIGWLRGERFITPSPWKKIQLEYKQSKLLKKWEDLSKKVIPTEFSGETFLLLYAMQMQPESNLDVWGGVWSDQSDLISRTAVELQKIGGVLLVKPNPKSKYELTSELIEVISRNSNVIALSHTTKMSEVFPIASGVLSVTGTIILECVMAGKPVAVLGNHELAKLPGITRIREPEDISSFAKNVQNRKVNVATVDDAVNVLRGVFCESYPGVLFDPLHQFDRATDENFHEITNAFSDVLSKLRNSAVKF